MDQRGKEGEKEEVGKIGGEDKIREMKDRIRALEWWKEIGDKEEDSYKGN